MIEFDSALAVGGGTATIRHLLHIEGYSHTKPLQYEHMDSQPVVVGGRTWRIRYHPRGIFRQGDVYIDHVAFVVFLDDNIPDPVNAATRFLLLDRAGNEMPAHTWSSNTLQFLPGDKGETFCVNREIVEAPECLADDCFKIRVDITVSTGFRVENREAPVPASDMDQHLGGLLVTEDGADVTFLVAGEAFHAHRCILAARSPVFKKELYDLFGAMGGSTAAATPPVRVHGVAPQVFRALLHFVYTDSLPPEMAAGRLADEQVVMVGRLLEAAERYEMPRLKLTCEDKLCRCVDTGTVAATLVLAHQRGCHRLKKACIDFLRCRHALKALMDTDGFQLITSNPTLLNELISKVIPL